MMKRIKNAFTRPSDESPRVFHLMPNIFLGDFNASAGGDPALSGSVILCVV